jgi:hypothetical protein
MEDAFLLSSSQELVPTDRSRLPAALHEPAAPVSRKYDVLMRYAAIMTVEATDHLEARKPSTPSSWRSSITVSSWWTRRSSASANRTLCRTDLSAAIDENSIDYSISPVQ